jgi:hypothetical protein
VDTQCSLSGRIRRVSAFDSLSSVLSEGNAPATIAAATVLEAKVPDQAK